MSKGINVAQAAAWIREHDNFLILMHKNPDGDTLGSGFALCEALRSLGKRANAQCDSPFPPRYAYMTEPMAPQDFVPDVFLAVDIADEPLIGARFADTPIDLCIDHHGSNSAYAALILCDPNRAATGELVLEVIEALGCRVNKYIAQCIYTAITTDTGCFRYSNTTPDCMRIAAQMMETGIDYASLNRALFEIKTRGRVELEQMAIASMEYAHGGKIAIMTITQDMLYFTRTDAADIEGITSMPRNISGVEAGITIREMKSGNYKISLRTVTLDAAAICAKFGGGGHIRAAGFECSGTLFDIKVALVAELEKELW